MKPLIGLTCSYEEEKHLFNDCYREAVEVSGGVPILLPTTVEPQTLLSYLEIVDGLILIGGDDINPLLFGENPKRELGVVSPKRDFFELNLCRLFLAKGKPILGICRGLQILNVAAGGSLFQDIASQLSESIQHSQKSPKNHPSHDVYIKKSSLLHNLIKAEKIKVNSFHHQAVKSCGRGFEIVAWAIDGVIEGIEKNKGFALGVQWHPERLWKEVENQKNVFLGLIRAAKGNTEP